MSRFFGTIEKKASDLGPAYAREIRQLRSATWAAVAQAVHDAFRKDIQRQWLNSNGRPERFSRPRAGWSAISEARQERYLEGVRHPHARTIEDVAKHAPGSREAFCNILWQVLSPKPNLTSCMNTVMVFGEEELGSVIRCLLSGQVLDMTSRLAELRTTGALVAKIRLLSHERDDCGAFEAGCALAQALCFHAVNPLFATVAQRLWNVVSKGVLEGLHNDHFQFSRCREGFAQFSDALWERLTNAEGLYGIHRLFSGPRFTWPTIVDMNRECIRGFATPGLERPDSLQSFLDYGPANHRLTRELDKDPLFISADSCCAEEKCNFESLDAKR